MRIAASFTFAACVALSASGQVPANKRLYVVTSAGMDFAPQINSSGMLAGAAGNLSYVWSQASGLIRIPGLVYPYGYGVYAQGVNDTGAVIGYDNNASPPQAILWTSATGTQALADFNGKSSQAYGINDSGHVVGQYITASGPIPFLWKPGVGWTSLPLDGGGSGGAFRINASDQILGDIVFQGVDQSVVWQPDGSVRYIGNLLNQTQNFADDINDRGYVCGGTYGPLGHIGYLLDPAGNYMPIYNPINQTYTTSASSVNNYNVVVGYAGTGSAIAGFIWSAADGFTFLNSVLAPGSTQWNIEQASSINNKGQISGLGKLNGTEYAVLLTPIPPQPLQTAAAHQH